MLCETGSYRIGISSVNNSNRSSYQGLRKTDTQSTLRRALRLKSECQQTTKGNAGQSV